MPDVLRRDPQQRNQNPGHGCRNRHIRNLAKVAFNFKDYTVERLAEMVGWDVTVIEGVLED